MRLMVKPCWKNGNVNSIYILRAVYPEYFLNILQNTLQKLITDNWRGMEGRYRFTVQCPTTYDGKTCKGRFQHPGITSVFSGR